MLQRSLGRGLHHAVWGMTLSVACGCAGLTEPLPTASSVDLARYMGTWYEIARLPMWAQRRCAASTADYRLMDSGKVAVRNACVTTSGDRMAVEGTATVVDPDTRAKFNVVFDQWAAKLVSWFTSSEKGNYWIVRLDPEYRWAVVGTPDRDYLWILARTPTMEDALYRELVEFSRQHGFETERLMRATP